MWKAALAFAIFAGVTVFVLLQGGDIDMSGEKHGVEFHAEPAAAASAPTTEKQ
jgi:hypothetical protein